MKHLFSAVGRRLCALTLALALTSGTVWAGNADQTASTLSLASRLTTLEQAQEESASALARLCRPYMEAAALYAPVSGFSAQRLTRYLRYGLTHSDLTIQEVVTRVNIGLDRSFYSGVSPVSDPGSITALVNKYHYLDSDFVPELAQMGSWYASHVSYLQPEAYEWFTKMADDARAEGLKLYCVSGYRSYDYQQTLYQNYAARSGQASADTYSARPGFSEHQTGLVADINTASRSSHFERTAHYQWLLENSWKYGFILRYPEGKEEITGYIFEPWHFRYVGLETAQAVYESGLTYDEYVASYLVE